MTFIIPVYNGESTIKRAIDSVLKQKGAEYKLIIVDDGSTDNTAKICHEYVDLYSDRVKYIYQKNNRQGAARNNAIQFVTSEYISFLDADDWLMDNYLECVYSKISVIPENKHPQIVMTLPIKWDERTGECSDWMDKDVFYSIFMTDGIIVNPNIEIKLYETEVNVCRKIISTQFIKEIDFKFEEGIRWEDVVPHFVLLNKCSSCMGIGTTGFYYRVGSDDQTTATRGSERLDVVKILRELLYYCEHTHNKIMYFAVMRIIVRFSIWCIRMTDGKVRRRLVNELHRLYVEIPKEYYVALKNGAKERYVGKDRLQYQLMMIGLRYKFFNPIFYWEWLEKLGEWIVKTILHADGKVQ